MMESIKVFPAFEFLRTTRALKGISVTGTILKVIDTPETHKEKVTADTVWLLVNVEYVRLDYNTAMTSLKYDNQKSVLREYASIFTSEMLMPGHIRVAVSQKTFDMFKKNKEYRHTFTGTMEAVYDKETSVSYLDMFRWCPLKDESNKATVWLKGGTYTSKPVQEIGLLLTICDMYKKKEKVNEFTKYVFETTNIALSGIGVTQGDIKSYIPVMDIEMTEEEADFFGLRAGLFPDKRGLSELLEKMRLDNLDTMSDEFADMVMDKYKEQRNFLNGYRLKSLEDWTDDEIYTIKDMLDIMCNEHEMYYKNKGLRNFMQKILDKCSIDEAFLSFFKSLDENLDVKSLEVSNKLFSALKKMPWILEQMIVSEQLGVNLLSQEYDTISIMLQDAYLLPYVHNTRIEMCDALYHLFQNNLFGKDLHIEDETIDIRRQEAILYSYLQGNIVQGGYSIPANSNFVSVQDILEIPLNIAIQGNPKEYLKLRGQLLSANVVNFLNKFYGKYIHNREPINKELIMMNISSEWQIDRLLENFFFFVDTQGVLQIASPEKVAIEYSLRATIQQRNKNAECIIKDDTEIYAAECEFRDVSGFALTREQMDTGYLLNNTVSVITGGAGTGKTTIIKYLTALAENFGDMDVELLAPTNKACRRVQECTGRPCRTLHSHLRIPEDNYVHVPFYLNGAKERQGVMPYVVREKKETDEEKNENTLYIIDESSMLSQKMVLAFLGKMTDTERVIFVGDSNQLPPINGGKPFADMLKYAPTKVLTVCKRVEEDSAILLRNAKAVLDGGEIETNEYFEHNVSFDLLNNAEQIKQEVQNLFSKLKGMGYNSEDIQVISAVNKGTIPWGTQNLNKIVQQIVNGEALQQPYIAVSDFSVYYCMHDKVIQTVANKDIVHYMKKANTYDEVTQKALKETLDSGYYLTSDLDIVTNTKVGVGLANGEVGIIEYIGRPAECPFYDLPNDVKGAECVMVVKYEDFSASAVDEFYVIHKLEGVWTTLVDDEGTFVFQIHKQIDGVQLAYALSVHKMQGSQNKVIVFFLNSLYQHKDFISKNMVYTGLTRASERVYLYCPQRALMDSMGVDAVENCHTLFTFISDEEKVCV